jgi:hypothetical protein
MKQRLWRRAALRPSLPLVPLLVLLLSGCALGATPTGPFPTATSGDLRLSTARGSYGTHTPVGLTLVNGSGGDYYAVDGRSGCTIVQLQRYDAARKDWLSVDGCTTPGQPHVLVIHAGMREPFTLAPTSASDANSWESGVYRVAAAYSANSDGVSGERIAYSAGFMIQD